MMSRGHCGSRLQRSVGGGSVMDTAKAANLCVAHLQKFRSSARIDLSEGSQYTKMQTCTISLTPP